MVNTYNTIEKKSEGLYKDKGSKFIALAYPITDPSEVKPIISELKKEYYDARHHCYAWRLGWEGEQTRTVDDGEPSSTAGKPILGQLVSKDLTNILIVVIRYFGGTKLGVSGLIKAYKDAAVDAIDNAEIVTKEIEAYYLLRFGYMEMNTVMKILKDLPVRIHSQDFDNLCEMKVSTRRDNEELFKNKFEYSTGIELNFIEHN